VQNAGENNLSIDTAPLRVWIGQSRTEHLLARCDPMTPDKLPKHIVLIRWGTFRLDLIGRGQILAALALCAAVIGLRLFHIYF
jgi:hypothetical protein